MTWFSVWTWKRPHPTEYEVTVTSVPHRTSDPVETQDGLLCTYCERDTLERADGLGIVSAGIKTIDLSNVVEKYRCPSCKAIIWKGDFKEVIR